MKINNIAGVLVSPLKIIDVQGGDVLHAMNSSDSSYFGFGEAYFSMVESGAVKAWKRHREMVLNLIVPIGQVRFIIYDDRENSLSNGVYQEVTLSLENYVRLTIPAVAPASEVPVTVVVERLTILVAEEEEEDVVAWNLLHLSQNVVSGVD